MRDTCTTLHNTICWYLYARVIIHFKDGRKGVLYPNFTPLHPSLCTTYSSKALTLINFRGRLQFISRVNNSIWVCEVLPIKCQSDVQSLSIFYNYCKTRIYKICIHISLTLFPTLQVNFRIYVFQYSYCVEYIWKYYNNFEVEFFNSQ